MNLLASFSGTIRVKLKNDHQPEDGFFYLSSIQLDDSLTMFRLSSTRMATVNSGKRE
jgi:hypothetical protein